MKPRHALVVGFGLGAIAVLALGGIAGGQTVVELAGKVRLLKPSPTAPPPAASRLLTPASAPRLTSPSPIPPPNSPGPRAGAIMVYDPENRGLILFGGSTTIPQPDGTNLAVSLGDTWLWDGVTWKNLNVDGPSPRSAAMAAYDSVRQEIVLFGGSGPGGLGPGLYFDDTWTWDGRVWHLRNPAHKPDPRMRAGMAFDQARGVVVMVGGEGAKVYISTWTWDGTDWTLRAPTTHPTARRLAGMAYSASIGKTILYGGTWAGRQLSDTWLWDGSNWRPGPAGPAAGLTSLTYDDALGEVVGFVYRPAENATVRLVTWNGAAWSDKTANAGIPSPRANMSFGYDAARSEVVMYGGSYIEPVPYAETWVWGGGRWSLWQPAAGA